jgi:hypothetical protein
MRSSQTRVWPGTRKLAASCCVGSNFQLLSSLQGLRNRLSTNSAGFETAVNKTGYVAVFEFLMLNEFTVYTSLVEPADSRPHPAEITCYQAREMTV